MRPGRRQAFFDVGVSESARTPPTPEALTLAVAMPLGVRRGVPFDLTLPGASLAGPTGLWTSFPAKVAIPTDKSNGKDNGSLRVRLDVAKDAPLGFGVIRLATA